jgi:PIN domain nuclease of toxin-antitoxin system
MSILLDTHFMLALLSPTTASHHLQLVKIRAAGEHLYVSVASLWEAAIKMRLGKLQVPIPLDEIAEFLSLARISLLPINQLHAVARAEPDPSAKDPFDRLLLAQCKIEGLRLATADRALAEHPLAWTGD